MKTTTLRNGIEMPMIGYGVYQVDPHRMDYNRYKTILCI